MLLWKNKFYLYDNKIKIYSKVFFSLENEARGNLGSGLLYTHSDGIFGLDQNCPPTLPLSQHFAQNEK